ncbi:hypothetical protein [Pantanalinema sp. GBBB05]|uniref:hypothetical protein n=1 Tax=Pantanalinema sp. GBBB05 TaxID=2604139 RepID=UPI003D815992
MNQVVGLLLRYWVVALILALAACTASTQAEKITLAGPHLKKLLLMVPQPPAETD